MTEGIVILYPTCQVFSEAWLRAFSMEAMLKDLAQAPAVFTIIACPMLHCILLEILSSDGTV